MNSGAEILHLGRLASVDPAAMTLAAVNALDPAAFTARFGGVAERSPWVAERAANARPFANRREMIAAVADGSGADQASSASERSTPGTAPASAFHSSLP